MTLGEEAGALLLRAHHDPGATGTGGDGPIILTAVGFLPVPEEHVTDRTHGLSYDARFHLVARREAKSRHAGMLLVHAHGDDPLPQPSPRDETLGALFLAFATRQVADKPHGLAVLGDNTLAITVQLAGEPLEVTHLDIVGRSRRQWPALPWPAPSTTNRPPAAAAPLTPSPSPALTSVSTVPGPQLDSAHIGTAAVHDADDGPDRQELAFGADSIRHLAARTVGVVGLSGGGSHVQQQLIYAGVGALVVNDPQKVSSTNPRRLVCAVPGDVDVTDKTDIAVRIAAAVRPEVRVIPVRSAFPAAAARSELRVCDVIIGCVDDWATRDFLNTFCLEHRIPYIDIGAAITPGTAGPRVSGQVTVVLPGGPCLREMGLVTDERVDAARQHALGYLDGEPEPQVVSINGTLASEAVTAALLLLTTTAAPVEARRRYAYPPGKLVPVAAPVDEHCGICRQQGLR